MSGHSEKAKEKHRRDGHWRRELEAQIRALEEENAVLAKVAGGALEFKELVMLTGAAYSGIKRELEEQKRLTEKVRSELIAARYRISSLETQRQYLQGRKV